MPCEFSIFGRMRVWLTGCKFKDRVTAATGIFSPEVPARQVYQEVYMTCILPHSADRLRIAPDDLHELVRGQEQALVDRLTPLVKRHSVMLDLSHVERIDAAGISALISLYGAARNAGNEFGVVNASSRVSEILSLVGLERILISHDAVHPAHADCCLAQPAA
jgi:anti-anti-sigma factor